MSRVSKAGYNPRDSAQVLRSVKENRATMQRFHSCLGACLLQDGHPDAYASRALTPNETNYAHIERTLELSDSRAMYIK